jgi:hypothetical protein
VGVKSPFVDDRLLSLPGTYHRHTIGTFNTCSQGPSHRSLIDTGEGYNLGGVGFSHTTSRPSQPMVSNFHLRAPSGLRLIISALPKDLKREQTLNLLSESIHSTSTVTYHLSIALLIRINRKVNLNVTTMPYNSYRLNAQARIIIKI